MDLSDPMTARQRVLRAHAADVRRLASMQLPMFGLPPGWSGQRETGATEVQTGVTRDRGGVHGERHESVELLHRSCDSLLSVLSADLPAPIDDAALRTLIGGAGDCAPMEVVLAGDR